MKKTIVNVTILILIDGFLQWQCLLHKDDDRRCHNPYFNRWFSAISNRSQHSPMEEECHNPYFNRWFSAIQHCCNMITDFKCHNPYFNRWFSAMIQKNIHGGYSESHNPYFNRWFSAIKEDKTIKSYNLLSQSLF